MTRLAIGLILVLSTGLILDADYADNADRHPSENHLGRHHDQLAEVSSEVISSLGQMGEMLLEQRTAVRDRSLPAGRHRVRHIRTENDHAVRFTPAGSIGLMYRPVDVACTLEPVGRRLEKTLVRLRVGDFRPRLLKLYIEGEKAAHVF